MPLLAIEMINAYKKLTTLIESGRTRPLVSSPDAHQPCLLRFSIFGRILRMRIATYGLNVATRLCHYGHSLVNICIT